MIEISGRESKIDAFIDRMREFGILEMVRTGRIAMMRDRTITEESGADTSCDATTTSKS
jgi:acetolactate synthase-1/3 small subunit